MNQSMAGRLLRGCLSLPVRKLTIPKSQKEGDPEECLFHPDEKALAEHQRRIGSQ